MTALTEIKENEMLVYENRKVEINNFEAEDELSTDFKFSSRPCREYDQCRHYLDVYCNRLSLLVPKFSQKCTKYKLLTQQKLERH